MIQSFWTSVFWPYFQFAVFLAVIVYFAKKPMHKYLEAKRDDFRTKLSEAHEALTLAERKINQYESQIKQLEEQVKNIEKQYLQSTELEQKKILAEAEASADSILNDAKRTASELIAQTQRELKQEMYSAVLQEFNNKLTPERLAALEPRLKDEAISSIPKTLNTHNLNSGVA